MKQFQQNLKFKKYLNSRRLGQEEGELTEEASKTEAPFLGRSYPNPAQGNFTLPYFLPTSYAIGKITLYDITGKQLATFPYRTGEWQTAAFNVSHLANGAYYYTLESGNLKIATGKMFLMK